MSRGLVAPGALAFFAACSPFAGDPTPAAPPDAGVEAKEAKDAGADANVTLDGGTSAFCTDKASAALCETFDGELYDTRWNQLPSGKFLKHVNQGTADARYAQVLVPGSIESPTASRADVLGLQREVDPDVRRTVTLSFAIRVTQWSPGQTVEVAKIETDQFNWHVNLVRTEEGRAQLVGQFFEHDGVGADVSFGALVYPGEFIGTDWHRIWLSLGIGGGKTNTYGVRLDQRASSEGAMTDYGEAMTSKVGAFVGLSHEYNLKGTLQYDIDDVLVTNDEVSD